jgi:hypothetical protein
MAMRSRRGIYLGVSRIHSSTVHLVLNPETRDISPQYHCVFDDTFSTVWSDENFDKILWNNLVTMVDSIDQHFSLQPNNDGTLSLPPNYVPFPPDIEGEQDQFCTNNNNNDNISNNNHNNNIHNNENNTINKNDNIPEISPIPNKSPSSSSPLLSRQIFAPSPSPVVTNNIPSQIAPRCSRRSNFGTATDKLDPSNHLATNYNDSSMSPSEQYCNALGIKLPSTSRGRTTSQGGCLKTSYTLEKQNLPKVKRNQLNSYYPTCINWSKLLTVCDSGITTLDAFKCEIQMNLTYENGYGIQILEYFNPALLIAILLIKMITQH